MKKILLFLSLFVAGAASLEACAPTNNCAVTADCLPGEACVNGACAAAPADAGTDAGAPCTSGATRLCGDAGVGACAPGLQTCVDGGWTDECAGAVTPVSETCNAIDDDCDGTVDDGLQQTRWYPDVDGDGYGDATSAGVLACARAGSVSVQGDCNDNNSAISPEHAEVCGNSIDDNCNGVTDENCGCANPGSMTSCCGGRGTQTCGTNGTLSACTATTSSEVCNGVDDDCDGQTDEGSELCGVGAGQACVSGLCVCSGGQSFCNGTCVVLSAEVCDGLDNDCNGQIDEGVNVGCYPDGDNDGYADSAAISSQCPVSDRPTFGTCPMGYVAPASSPDLDCALNDGAHYRIHASRADGDGDGMCLGAPQSDCVGVSALPGRRFSNECLIGDDCDDANPQASTEGVVRDDADGDTFCSGATTSACLGTSWVPAGKRRVADCQATDDCNDSDAQVSGFVSVRADGDNDGYCTGAAASACGVPAGYRLASACQATDDCNDANAGVFISGNWAADADSDGHCAAPPPAGGCIGSTPPAGYRAPASCLDFSDCADNNAQFYTLEPLRDDGDNDGYCVNPAVNTCSSPSVLPAGKKRPGQCQATDDCNDANSTLVIIGAYAPDGDNDGYCTVPPPSSCVAATPPAGYRRPADCTGFSDCAPSDATKYRTVSLRADADNDSWCSGLASNACIGASPPSGQRIASDCLGEDCSETNAYANSTCLITEGYYTSSHTQTCPSANTPTLYNVTVLNICPVGFNTVNYRAVRSSGTGSCTYGSPSQVYQQCNFLDGSTCGVVADCQAL